MSTYGQVCRLAKDICPKLVVRLPHGCGHGMWEATVSALFVCFGLARNSAFREDKKVCRNIKASSLSHGGGWQAGSPTLLMHGLMHIILVTLC